MQPAHFEPFAVNCDTPATVPPCGASRHGRGLDAPRVVCSNGAVQSARILALDFGTRNVGLAASDDLGMIVRPLPSIPNKSQRDLVRRLRELVREQEVVSLVIGLPLNMDGTYGEAVQRIRRIAALLMRELALPVREVDERLSTVEAMDLWKSMKARQQQRYRTVDSLAAALILERFLKES